MARNLKHEPEVILSLISEMSSQPPQFLQFLFPSDDLSNDGKDALRRNIYKNLTGELAGHCLLTEQMLD